MTKGAETWTFEYDANGMRTKRACGDKVYTYVYSGSQLTAMTYSSHKFLFTYDAAGKPLTLEYHDTFDCQAHTGGSCGSSCKTYYYVTNLQGDVIALLDSSGYVKAEYAYDAWGNHVETPSSFIGNYNPLRYRGYVYDRETKLYYLQSRYYNPEIGRFINADGIAYLGADGTPLSYNLYAYCRNNPVMGYDPTGHFDLGAFLDVTLGVFAGLCGVAKGITTALRTVDPRKKIAAGIAAGVETFGAINNTINAVYYEFSDGQSGISTNSYVDEYLTRWERLDYTKQQTGEQHYNLNAWRYHSEYSLHMSGWYLLGWAHDNPNYGKLYEWAGNFSDAGVLPNQWDSRWYVNIATAIMGGLGI